MAFDHDATNNDHDHDDQTDDDQVTGSRPDHGAAHTEQAPPVRKRWATERDEPISTPPDDEPRPIVGESYAADNEGAGDFGQLIVVLRKDRLAEFDATVRAIRDAKASGGNDGNDGNECSLPDALIALCRGEGEGVSVTMNVYVDGTNTTGT